MSLGEKDHWAFTKVMVAHNGCVQWEVVCEVSLCNGGSCVRSGWETNFGKGRRPRGPGSHSCNAAQQGRGHSNQG